MLKFMETGPEVPSLSSKYVLLNRTGLKYQEVFQDSAWFTWHQELSLCSGLRSGLETTFGSNTAQLSILPQFAFLSGWCLDLPACSWLGNPCHILCLHGRKEQEPLANPSSETATKRRSCSQGWEKPPLHVLSSAYSRRNYRSYVKWAIAKISGKYTEIIARIFSVLPLLPTSHRKKKKNRERENSTFLVGVLCFKIFFLLGMKEMIRGKTSSFLSSAATICKPSSNIFETLD